MAAIKDLTLIIMGFGSGLMISGAVFAFIAVIGVVPRFAQKTGTQQSILIYEEALIFGGIFGTAATFLDLTIHLPRALVALYSAGIGVFYGCFAISLAEVLKALPILTRRIKIAHGIIILVIALAIGKLIGSLLYFRLTGFYNAQ